MAFLNTAVETLYMDYFPEEILRRDESCKVVKRRSQILRVRSEIFRELWVSSFVLGTPLGVSDRIPLAL